MHRSLLENNLRLLFQRNEAFLPRILLDFSLCPHPLSFSYYCALFTTKMNKVAHLRNSIESSWNSVAWHCDRNIHTTSNLNGMWFCFCVIVRKNCLVNQDIYIPNFVCSFIFLHSIGICQWIQWQWSAWMWLYCVD